MWPRLFTPRLLLVATLTLSLAPAVAFAGTPESAARHFADGQKAFTAGDYPHAGDEFEAAYRDKPHHAPLWNAARSWQRAGEDVRAANLYAHYLRVAPPDAPDRDQATASLRTLASRMGRIELHASGVEQLKLDGKDVTAPDIYVAPGEHVAEADDKGKRVRRVVKVRAGEQVSVSVAPDPVAPLVGPPRPIEPARKPLPPIVTIVGGVLTVAAGSLTIVSGLDTKKKREDFPMERTQDNLDTAFASQTRTNILLGTTVGLGVITGVIALFFTDWGGKKSSSQVGVAR
jgi:antitoxin (DNA-binding transcriptional repressor) of toxin-antitoxin stability system